MVPSWRSIKHDGSRIDFRSGKFIIFNSKKKTKRERSTRKLGGKASG